MRRVLASGAAMFMCLAVAVPPALAQEEAAANDVAAFHTVSQDSVVVSGTASCRSSTGGDSTDGAVGWLYLCALDMSDPRVTGDERHDRFHLLAFHGGVVWVAEDAQITNDEGSWRGTAQAAEDQAGSPVGEAHYVGEGAYEGLEFHYYFSAAPDPAQAVVRGWITSLPNLPAD